MECIEGHLVTLKDFIWKLQRLSRIGPFLGYNMYALNCKHLCAPDRSFLFVCISLISVDFNVISACFSD